MAEENDDNKAHESGHEHKEEAGDAELQQHYLDLQLLEVQIKELQQQAEAINSQVVEMSSAIASVQELSRDDKPKEALVPIAGGIFAKGEIKNTKNLVVSVGANVCVEKTADETVKLIKERLYELKKYNEQLVAQINQLSRATLSVESEVKNILRKKGSN